MKKILQEAYDYAKAFTKEGKIVDYIPALAGADKNEMAASIIDSQGNTYDVGSVETKFTMMSIAKVILYLIALENYDLEEIKKYVGLKGSSKPYNSLLDLEMSEEKKPVNPFINAGALVTSYLIYKKFDDKSEDQIMDKVRMLSGNNSIDHEPVDRESKGVGHANKAIMYSLENNNIIPKDVDIHEVLYVYGVACNIMINTRELATISYVLSTGGYDISGKQLIESDHARILRTLMATCGTYDYSGDFAVEIGLPAKSGVGGGILATTNKKIGLASYCPGLDKSGNSLAGAKMLEYISKQLDLSIY